MRRPSEVRIFCSKAYLGHIRSEVAMIDLLRDDLDRMESALGGKGIDYTRDAVAGGGDNTVEHAIARYIGDKDEYEAELSASSGDLRIARRAIRHLPDPAHREVLKRYYLWCDGWDQISRDLGFSQRHARRIRDSACDEVYDFIPRVWQDGSIPKAI